ncbi:PHP domain-containing protein [Reinekea forsetii]|nr:PHP domain-containing protein [Reinekea forsetii]
MHVNVKQDWDLHCHSQFSDGKLSCPDLFNLAVEREIKHLVLTDHDTAAGYRAAIDNSWVPDSLTLHPGAELSCVWKGRSIHVVALGIDVQCEGWLAVEQAYIERREKRFERILFVLRRAGFECDEARIRQISEPGPPARPQIAQYLVETEQVKSTAHAFKKWLGRGTVGDVKSQWPELDETVKTITQFGGLAVIAHPHRYNLTWTKCKEMLDDFNAAGGEGIEASCVGMNPNMRKFLIEQAQQRGMYISGGSDFHSPNTSWLKLGYFPQWPRPAKLAKDWLLANSQLQGT